MDQKRYSQGSVRKDEAIKHQNSKFYRFSHPQDDQNFQSITGWRLGYVIVSPEIIDRVKKVHDFLAVGVGAVPGSSFFRENVNHLIRFHFAKQDATLNAAVL